MAGRQERVEPLDRAYDLSSFSSEVEAVALGDRSMQQCPDKLLAQQQLADELEVSLRTLERWRQEGTGPAFIRVGRSPRYRRADIGAWLERQRRGGGQSR